MPQAPQLKGLKTWQTILIYGFLLCIVYAFGSFTFDFSVIPGAAAVTFFYNTPPTGPASFSGLAYYGLPFLLVNSGFAGYTAYAISRET
ncbi:MAG: hypothetical protein ABID71_05490 [Chloroflexota bacterium]